MTNTLNYDILYIGGESLKHELKTLPKYFRAVLENKKTFEVRKNDRDFKVGDILILKEWTPRKGYSGNEISKKITYILDNSAYCKENYVILGFN